MAGDIPIEPFDDEEQPAGTLGPAGIEEAVRPLSAMLGEEVVVFLRDDVSADDVAMPLVPVPAAALVAMLPRLLGGDRPGVTLVSDGHVSHAVTVLEERGGRLIFFDPWNTSSFLQEGHNVAGVKAQSQGGGQYSVTADELTRVIVAEGVAGLEKVARLVEPPTWDQFRGEKFYRWFHLRPDGEPVPHGHGVAMPHKPGAFREYLDFGFELDAESRLRAGVIEVDQKWLLGENRMMGLDILKGFIDAMVTREMRMRPIGITVPPVVASPDLHLTGALVDVLTAAMRGQQPAVSKRLERIWPIVGVIGGQSEEATLPLVFTRLRAVSRNGMLLLRIEARRERAATTGGV